jgi:hypothetical protein
MPDFRKAQTWISIFCIVVCILVIIAAIGFLTGRWSQEAQSAEPVKLESSKYDERIIELDRQALEQAYMTQVAHVFAVWVKDGVPPPARAAVGFSNARKAYIDAMTAIDKRQNP